LRPAHALGCLDLAFTAARQLVAGIGRQNALPWWLELRQLTLSRTGTGPPRFVASADRRCLSAERSVHHDERYAWTR